MQNRPRVSGVHLTFWRKKDHMSIEEIIHAWKNGHQPGKKPAKASHASKEMGKEPANPSGETELSDEELEIAEGGLPEFINSLNESCYVICENKE